MWWKIGDVVFAFHNKQNLQYFFSIEDLYGARLQYLEQYEDLMPDKRSESKMNVTQSDIDSLPLYEIEQQAPATKEVIVIERPIYVEPRRKPTYTRSPARKIEPKTKPKRYHGSKPK